MNNYVLLYGEKKIEDNICVLNMFKNTKKINLGWLEIDNIRNMKIIEEEIKNGVNQIIFLGLEIGWKFLIYKIKDKYTNIKIKIICTTLDSLLYYDYERNNFLDLLEISKDGKFSTIAFLRKGQYNTYNRIGYNCCYLKENFILNDKNVNLKKKNKGINLGIYPLNYTWDKNIFNQLCVAKFIDNCILNFNELDKRMVDFLNTMKIENFPVQIKEIKEENIVTEIKKNDVVIASSFTEYFHTVFFISMEMGIPCLVGNTIDFLDLKEDEKLREYIVTEEEDNPILNAKKIKNIIENKEEIIKLYNEWKEKYNIEAKQSINKFLEI